MAAMKTGRAAVQLLIAAVWAVAVCFPLPLTAQQVLDRYRFADPEATVELPSSLREVSGLACTADGRLFAHNDEEGTVFQVDAENGEVRKTFFVVEQRWYGRDRVFADFEGIALADGRFFLVTSSGTLYEFPEGADGEEVLAVRYDTALHEGYDVEGLCYDPGRQELLLACKQWPEGLSLKDLLTGAERWKKRKKLKPVFAFSLSDRKLRERPRFVIDTRHVKERTGHKKFRPSALALVAANGRFLALSASGSMLAEYSIDGALLDAVLLLSPPHGQPEGLAMGPDGTLYIADEGVLHGWLTRYCPLHRP